MLKINSKYIILLITIPFLLILLLILKNKNEEIEFVEANEFKRDEQSFSFVKEEEQSYADESVTLIADIKGEVVNPGVYEFTEGDRVNDLIKKAGGLREDANESAVNLAEKLEDEMVIVIPHKDDDEGVELVTSSINQASSVDESRVKMNEATELELQSLPGIGPSKAEAIMTYREEHGPFATPEDLLNISGIGEKTLENLIDHIQIP